MEWRFQLIERPYGGVTEGPIWDGEALYFTHIPTSRIMRYDPGSGGVSEWRGGTNHTNGLAYDTQGRLYGCCSGGRSIVRFEPDGSTTTVADRVDGQKLNTPNDLAIDHQGRIWFTNPWNVGNIDPAEVEELDNRSVLRADPQPDGSYTVTRVTFDTTMPNGVLVSPDDSTLYVAESNSADIGLDRELRAYPVNQDGSLGPYRTLHTFGKDRDAVHRGIDGMCFDVDGNIVATAGWPDGGPGPMIYVFSPTGTSPGDPPGPGANAHQLLLRRPRPDHPVRHLHRGHFFRAETDRVGWAMYP